MISQDDIKAPSEIILDDEKPDLVSVSQTPSPRKQSELNKDIVAAFNVHDSALSRRLHEEKRLAQSETAADERSYNSEEAHKDYGDYVKSIVYGGLDGIITTFAVVSGVAGADLNVNVILVLGFANLAADGLSMGLGDYLSELAEVDFVRSEKERELWEFDNFPEGEIDEMVQIYVSKGISEEDAKTILYTMSKYRTFFVDHMMVQELDIKPEENEDAAAPWKNGCVTMASFLAFGCVPLLSYLIFASVEFSSTGFDPKFLVSILLTIVTLACLGAVKARMTNSSVIKSMAFVCINGTVAAAASYFIGYGLSMITGIHGAH